MSLSSSVLLSKFVIHALWTRLDMSKLVFYPIWKSNLWARFSLFYIRRLCPLILIAIAHRLQLVLPVMY